MLRWKEVPGAKAYELQIAKDPTFVEVVLQTQTTTAGYRWEELPTATHWYRVRSFDADGRPSEWSPARTISIDSVVPEQVRPDDGAAFTCGETVTFEVQASKVVKEYVLELSASADFAVARQVRSPEPLVRVGDLAPGAWWWRVKTVDLKDREAGPGPARALRVRLVAPRPRPTADVLVTAGQVTLGWAPVACAARWVVEATHDGKERVAIASTQPSLAFKTSTAGEYRWRVAGVDAAGRTGDFSVEQTFHVKLPTPVPRGEQVRGRFVEVSWGPVVAASGYLVELLAAEAQGPTLASASVTATSWKSPELKPGPYAWRVTAKDTSGHASAPTAPRTFELDAPTTLATPVLESPAQGAAVDEGAPVEVAWGAVAGATRYEVAVDDGVPVVVTEPRHVVPPPGRGLHAVKARALSDDAVSRWSQPWPFFWGVPPVAQAQLELVGQELRVTLRDERGAAVGKTAPRFSVARGAVGPAGEREGRWVMAWTPPGDGRDVLTVEERAFRAELPLAAPEPGPLVVGAFAGGVFNGGAVVSPSLSMGVAWRLPPWRRRLAVEVRGGLFVARGQAELGPLTVAGDAWLWPFALMAAWHQPLSAFVLRGALGPGFMAGAFTVDGVRSTTIAPGLELAVGLGRRLGPGRVEVEVGFSYARFDTEAFRLNAGGFAIRVGYAVDLLGGR